MGGGARDQIGVNSPIDHYFVDHGAGLLAALRVWGKSGEKTDADIRALIDLADAVTLENLAEVLAHSHDADDLHASVQLEAIAFATSTLAIRHHSTSRGRGFNRADKAEVGVAGPSPGLDDEGVVTAGPARWNTADSWLLSMN
jgi:hypothetical protein